MEKRKFPEPQPFSTQPRPPILLSQVQSRQIAAIGYDEATKTLAVQFCSRGPSHFYHYPDVEPEVHQAFMAADSKGNFFNTRLKHLPFEKYQAQVDGEQQEAARAGA